jgi:hypothetical protein
MKELLKNHKNQQEVENFISYIGKLRNDPKSFFIKNYTDTQLAQLFLKVANEGLVFD